MHPGQSHGIALRLLGTVDLIAGDRVIELGSAKQRALLAALLVRLNRLVPVDVLVDDLWGESPPVSVQVTLQSLVSRLRRALDATGPAAGSETPRLWGRDRGYVLQAPPDRVDAFLFDRLVADGRQALARGQAALAADELEAALALWRGAALGDLADRPFARPEAQRLEEARLGAIEDLAEALMALGRAHDALARVSSHVAAHPLRERPWGQMMLALYRLGRQADALQAYQQVRHILREELGVQPTPELRRLCEQILRQSADLTAPVNPAVTTAAHRGEHRLADLAHPEWVYQGTHPDLPRSFPPWQSVDARRHNLPVALTSFVGRERELGEVVSLLATSRLLTLAGIGGVGKTRLALQAAAGVLGRFPDGAWFVELAPVRDPDLVTNEVITSLGLLPSALAQPGQALEQRLCDHLRGRRLLLVLDNCEHVVEAAARLAHTVLARCADITVLATSREVLGLPGEVVWNVPPLSMPANEAASVEELAGSDAVTLFCERARAAQPGFGLSDANAAAVARICRRLDGIPLGLELAAGKIRALAAHQVADRLDDRFRLLTGGSRTAIPRHQTLRAAMEWGYTLLPAAEQGVLRRLSVFPGTFSLAAVEAVVATAPPDPTSDAAVEVLDLLSRLVDKSMVSVSREEPEVRYGLLETVREFAGQKLTEAGEANDVHTRHRDFFLRLADNWAQRTDYWDWWLWIPQISADHDNFAAALHWSWANGDHDALLRLAAAQWPYWYWGEAPGWRHWLPEALDRCDTSSPARVEALIALASLLMRSGEDTRRWEALFDEAHELAVSLASEQLVAQVNFYHAHAFLSRGEPRKAEKLLRDSFGRSTNADFVGWCHWALGWIALHDDHLDKAATEFRTSLQLADQVDDESMRAHVRPALALVAALRGDQQTARTIAAQGIRSAERIVGAPRVLMLALALAGQVAVLSGDDSAAAPLLRLLRLLRDKGVTYWADEALAVAAIVLADRLPEEAAVVLTSSKSLRGALDGTGSQLGAMTGRLRRCRTQLIETLGPQRWQQAERKTLDMPVEEAIVRALAALETLSCPDG